MFCDPNQKMVDNFIGENPRPENDLLISEDISKENDEVIKITCAKKHYLQSGNKIALFKKDANLRTFCSEVIDVVSDKAFTLKGFSDLDIGSYYVIKLLSRRNHQERYVSVNTVCKFKNFSTTHQILCEINFSVVFFNNSHRLKG